MRHDLGCKVPLAVTISLVKFFLVKKTVIVLVV